MSSIIFDRILNYTDPRDTFNHEEEEMEHDIEEENLTNINSPSSKLSVNKAGETPNQIISRMIEDEQINYAVISRNAIREYSFGIQPFEKEYIEIAHFNCEDKFIEPYIDSEEFPPVLVDFLNRNKNNKGAISDICDSMYKNGLVLAKFQDHRQPGYRNDFFVFLRQRPLNIFNDTKKIVKWSIDDQLEYESKIMQMSTPKLCLDTDPNINAEIKRILAKRKSVFGGQRFQRVKRLPYKRALSPCQAKSEFNLLQFLTRTTAFRLQEPSREKPGTVNDHELFNSYQYKDVNEIAKDLTHTQNDSPEIIKEAEYIFEHLDELNRCARLIIFRRPFCETFFGTLINGKNADCKTPDFSLGTSQCKEMYVKQFILQYTENGNKKMKIIEQIGDQPPKERLTFAAKKMIGNPEALLEEFPLAKVEQMLPKGTCNAYLKESASSSLTPVEHQHLLSPSISVVGKGASSVNNTGLPNYSLSTTVPYLLPTNASLNHISSNRNVATPNSQSHQIDKNDHVENYISFPVPSRDSFTEKESNSREQLPNVVHQQKLQTINESTSKD